MTNSIAKDDFSYWAFLGYSHQDNLERRSDTQDVNRLCWADWLHDALKTFSTPAEFAGQINARGEIIPERIDPIFQDDQERPEDANLSANVREALEQSRYLVVICSPGSAKSLYVNEEVRYFKQLGRGNRILSIVVAGEPNASDENKAGISPDDECFVPAMRHPVMPDGTLDVTRLERGYIFADARHGDDKREILAKDHRNAEAELQNVKIQLIAGLIGVGFNGLLRCEQKRRFAGFAEAQYQIQEARNQVREAESKVLEAQNQAREAQGKLLEALNQARPGHSQPEQVQIRDDQSQVLELQNRVREAQNQVEQARNQVQEAESKVVESQNQAREALNQLEEARKQAREAESKVLEIQNQIGDTQSQLQAAQNEALEAQNQAREARSQVEEARNQTRDAESKVLEAQKLAREVQNQLEETRNQVRDAQNKVLEVQNLPQDVHSQIQAAQNEAFEAQNQAREARSQVEEARNQAREAESKVLEARNLARETQNQLEETQKQVREAQDKLLEAQNQTRSSQNQPQEALVRDDQSQVQELQNQVRETQNQVEEARNQAREAQSKVLEANNLAREAQNQLEETRKQAQEAQNKVLEIQNQTQDNQSQLRSAQNKALEAQKEAQESQSQVAESRNQARDAQSKFLEVQNKFQGIQNKARTAQRLTKVFAVMAALALLAAGMATRVALRQRNAASPTLAKVTSEKVQEPDLAQGKTDAEQIPQALLKMGGQDGNPVHSLDELVTRIPAESIPDALKESSAISEDRQRSHFQKQLLLRMSGVNPSSAMASASTIDGNIVNDDGLSDSRLYFQLVVLDRWMKTNLPEAFGWVSQLPDVDSRQRALEKIVPALAADNPTNALTQLNELKPVPGEQIYTLLFEHWATNDPVQAILQRQQVPGQDADDKMLCAVMSAWMDKQPDAALNWLKSQPDSESKNKALETCIGVQAKTDVTNALATAESLPEGIWRDTVIMDFFNDWAAKDLDAATTACQQLPDGTAKEKAWECVLIQRMWKNPASAAEYVKNLVPGDFRQGAIETLCNHWAGTDAPAALAWAQSLPSGVDQVAAINNVVANWVQKDPQAAMQVTNQYPELSGYVVGEIAKAWLQSDFTAATNWVENLPDGEKKDAALLALASSTEEHTPQLAANFCTLLTTSQPPKEVVQDIASSLARDGLTNAVEWARNLKDDGTRQAAISALSEPWARNDPKGMATYALGLPAGDAQTKYLTAACCQLAVYDLPGTVELLKQLSDAELRRNILEQAARACDSSHIDQAAKYVASMPIDDDQKAAIKGLLSTWTPADPETAANWVCSFPENNPQKEQVESVIKAWSQTEPGAAAKWLANLPAGTTNEGIVSAFLEGAVEKYPEFAGQWTQSVTDKTQRQKFEIQVAQQWLKTDPSAALKWINTLDLPEETKQSLKAPSP